MDLKWFRGKFLSIAHSSHPEAVFVDDVCLLAGANDAYDGPARVCADLVELDGDGRFHLWTFASIYSPDLASGEPIGRLFAFDRVFRAADRAVVSQRITEAARRRRYDTGCPWLQRRLARLRAEFASWNLVVCGGRGCELAGTDDNLLFQLYAPLSDMVGAIRDVNTWHFYQTDTGFDLRSLWDVATPMPLSAGARLDIALGRPWPLPAPDDDFDIRSKRDLHMKRRKGFHAQAWDAYFGRPTQARAG
jgi:hypothetical protein